MEALTVSLRGRMPNQKPPCTPCVIWYGYTQVVSKRWEESVKAGQRSFSSFTVSPIFFFQSFFSFPFLLLTSGIHFLSLCRRHSTLQGFRSQLWLHHGKAVIWGCRGSWARSSTDSGHGTHLLHAVGVHRWPELQILLYLVMLAQQLFNSQI